MSLGLSNRQKVVPFPFLILESTQPMIRDFKDVTYVPVSWYLHHMHGQWQYLGEKPAGHLNIKTSSYQYRDYHVKDKTVLPTVLSLTWESPCLGKTVFILRRGPGGHLSIKTPFYQYSDYHYNYQTISRPSYLYNENPIPGNITFVLRRVLVDNWWSACKKILKLHCNR